MMKSSGAVDKAQVSKLLERARREVDEGLLPSVQIALARNGELIAEEAFGDASITNRFCILSATKPFVASVIWTLMAEGRIDVSHKVIDYFPEFAAGGAADTDTAGKAEVTIEQLMVHTCGFPSASLGPPSWADASLRAKEMSQWSLEWQPGTRYEYHATSAHWVLAEIIERITGLDYRDVLDDRITGPAGLPRILGIPVGEQGDIVDLVAVGEQASLDELEAAFGTRQRPDSSATDELVQRHNDPLTRSIGVPGAGGFGRARDIALFYQELLHNSHEIWDPSILADATGCVRNNLPDPMGVPANRALGVILAGDDGKANMRGLGRTVSPMAFGHNGAGGQLAWADPATGLSLGYVTNGYDRHELRDPRRRTSICSIAGTCVSV